MLRFKTLGGALVEGRDGPATGAVTQRRRVALLALLAASGPGISRDRIAALLWPESDEERARHALAQLFYGLRRELGDDPAVGPPTALRLNAEVMASDVREFEAALGGGDLARAAALYAGSFLDGFHLPGCGEFERWVEEQRASLAERAGRAVETLATRAEAAGDLAGAATWWRRLAALRPLSSAAALSLMKALVAAGDRPGALQHARVHETLVREEIGTAPDPALTAYAATLAATSAPPASAAVAPPAAQPAVDATDATDAAPPNVDRGSVLGRPSPGAARVRRRGRAAVVGAGLVSGAAVAAWFTLGRGAGDASGPGGRRAVVIADVENATGDAVFDRTIPVALAAALAQSPHARALSPDRVGQALARMRRPGADSLFGEALAREVARREGAAVVAVPAAERAEGAYELSVRVVDAATGEVVRLSAVRAATRADVLGALDQLGRRLRLDLGESRRSVAANTVPLPRVTTASLDALEKFAGAQRAFRAARLDVARALWADAVALDPAFATAHANLGMLAFWTNRPSAGDTHYTRALALLDALPERERTMIRASASRWRGDRAASAALLRAHVAAHPGDVEAWGALGYDYVRTDRHREAVDAFARVLALDSLDVAAWVNLATAEKALGNYERALAAYRRAWAIDTGRLRANDNLNLEYARLFVLAGRPDSAEAVVALHANAADPALRARGLRSQAFLDAHRGHYAHAARRLTEAITLTRRVDARVSELRNWLLLAAALDERGEAADAGRALDSAYALGARADLEPTLLYWLGKPLARAGDVRRARRLLARLAPKVHAGSATDRAALEALRGELLVAEGRAESGVAHLDSARVVDSSAVVLESLAYAAATAGAFDRAAAVYERVAARDEFGWEGQHAQRLARYWLGRVHENAGRPAAARVAYERFLADWPNADAGLRSVADAGERLARLRAAGDRER